MRMLTEKDFDLINGTVCPILKQRELTNADYDMAGPFLFVVHVPLKYGSDRAVDCGNAIFHALGLLPQNRILPMDECSDYCAIYESPEGEFFDLLFNHPIAMQFKQGDEEYEYTIKGFNEREEAEAEAEEEEMAELLEGIKCGALKSKSTDGYLVLAGEFYDAIESGEKTIEYRDFTEYNLKRTIGLKTVRFSRGYGSKGKAPKQMRCEVKSVRLMDADGNECDPFDVPEDFWPTAIALHLGKIIG